MMTTTIGHAGYWRSWALLALCACMLAALFRLGNALGMDRTFFSFRYLGQGQVIAALGHMVPGEPRDYMLNRALIDLASRYWNSDHDVPLTRIIEEAKQATVSNRWAGRSWVIDDKGFVDWLPLAFELFGFHKRSVYYTYFILLTLPMCVYAAYFFKRPAYLFVLAAFIVSLYVTAPILTINDQLSGLHEQRLFAVVGFVPAMTVLLVMSEAPLSVGAIAVVTAQAAALVFVYHCRNDSLWLTLCVAAAIPLFFWRLRRRFTGERLKLAGRLVWPLLIIGADLFALDRYKHAHYNPAYYELGYASHAYSHNLAMGLSYNPRLAKQYGLAVDDSTVIRLVGRHMIAHGAPLTSERDATMIFNNDFNEYGTEVRAAVLDVIKAHPIESLLSVAYKIGPIADEFLYIAGYQDDDLQERRAGHGLASPAAREAKSLYYRPFRFTALIAIAIAAALASGAAVEDWRTARLVVTMVFLGSLVVPFVVIAMMYLMGPAFVAAPLFAYVAIVSTATIHASRREPFSLWRSSSRAAFSHVRGKFDAPSRYTTVRTARAPRAALELEGPR